MGSPIRQVRDALIRLFVALVIGAVAPVAGAASTHPFARFGSGRVRSDSRSGGAVVRAELCRSSESGRRPAVVVLHGCGGFSTFDHRLATELPRHGVSTLDVDYFEPTPPPGRRGFCGARDAVGAAFPVWRQEVVDAADHVARLPRVDSRRIGLVGWSLGGGVALATAASRPASSRPSRCSPSAATHPLRPGPCRRPFSSPAASTTRFRSRTRACSIRRSRAPAAPRSSSSTRTGTHRWPGRQGTAGIARAAAFLRRYLG